MKLKFSAFCSSSEWSCHAGVELRVQKAVIFCGDAAPVISWWPRLLFKTRLPVRTNPWVALLWRSSLIVPWRSPPTAPEAAGMQESDVASAMGFCKTNLHCKTLILLHVCVFVLWTGVFVQTWTQKVPAPPFIRTSLKNASASLDCVFWFWHFLLCFCPGMTSGEPFLHALSKGRFTFRTVWKLDLKRVCFLCGDNVFGFFRRVLLALKTESGHLVEQNLLLFSDSPWILWWGVQRCPGGQVLAHFFILSTGAPVWDLVWWHCCSSDERLSWIGAPKGRFCFSSDPQNWNDATCFMDTWGSREEEKKAFSWVCSGPLGKNRVRSRPEKQDFP